MELSIVVILFLLVYHIHASWLRAKQRRASELKQALSEIEWGIEKTETLAEIMFWRNELLLLHRKYCFNTEAEKAIDELFVSLRIKLSTLNITHPKLYATN
jgi:hypothetical protein